MAPDDTQNTSDVDSTDVTGAPESAPAPRKRASRRATTKASAPKAAAEQTAETHDALGTPDAVATTDAAAATLDAVAPQAAPAKKRAPRKSAAKKAAEAQLPTDDTPEAVADEVPVKAAKKAPAKRGSRAKKAAVPAQAAEVPVELPGLPVESPVEPVEAPATEAPRKRTRAKKASAPVTAPSAPEEATLAEALEMMTAEDDAPGVVSVITADEVLADLDLPAVADQEDDDEDEQDEAPVAPTFGLLFQAPDPTKARRSRRASAPAMAPVHQDDEPAEAAEDDTRDEPSDQDDALARPARSRSRRRRGAEQAQDDAVEATTHDDTSDTTDESGADERDDEQNDDGPRRRRSRGGRGRKRSGEREDAPASEDSDDVDGEQDAEQNRGQDSDEDEGPTTRRRRRRRRSGAGTDGEDAPGVITRVREPRRSSEATGIKGSTRLEAKKQRRREGREAGRRRTIITEAEFLARRESVERSMVVRVKDGRTQIAVLEDGVLVEHYVSQQSSESSTSIAGNIYLGRVQNVLPSMEAAFVDIGKGRNAVLYAGEVNWDAAGLENGQARRIENAHKSGDTVLVQATKDPIGHKGARLTSQISLPGRYLVFVPNGNMTGISRKLPDTERARLKKILREVVPDKAGVIVRTAAEGASEAELRADVARLTSLWEDIQAKAAARSTHAPALLHGEPDLTVRVIRDVFNEDFSSLVVSGDEAWSSIKPYIDAVAPDLADRVSKWDQDRDVFAQHRIDEQLAKAMDRKVYLPSGGSLVIDRTEAMTVVDVNTGKFTGAGGNLEETVTKNNIEAAEEVVRQLRLRDIGGIIVVDFIDMVLESNRDLVVRRLVECLGRDRTKHQVAEVTSLGLVQMTRKRVGTGLVEAFSEVCTCCNGRGLIIHDTPVGTGHIEEAPDRPGRKPRRGRGSEGREQAPTVVEHPEPAGPTPAQIAAAAHAAAQAAAAQQAEHADDDDAPSDAEVAAAIEQAVSSALGESTPEPVADDAAAADEPTVGSSDQPVEESEQAEQAEPERRTRRSRRAGRSSTPVVELTPAPLTAVSSAPVTQPVEPAVEPVEPVAESTPEPPATVTQPVVDPAEQDEQPSKRRSRRSGGRVSTAVVTLAPAALDATPIAAPSLPAPVVRDAETTAAAAQAEPRARRTRRSGRVVAPAGPPRADDAPATGPDTPLSEG